MNSSGRRFSSFSHIVIVTFRSLYIEIAFRVKQYFVSYILGPKGVVVRNGIVRLRGRVCQDEVKLFLSIQVGTFLVIIKGRRWEERSGSTKSNDVGIVFFVQIHGRYHSRGGSLGTSRQYQIAPSIFTGINTLSYGSFKFSLVVGKIAAVVSSTNITVGTGNLSKSRCVVLYKTS